MNEGQVFLDTRALEIATQALAKIDEHVRDCKDDKRDLKTTITEGFADLHERIDVVHARINETNKSSSGRLMKIAGTVILVLLGVVGVLFMRNMGWA